MAILAMRRVSIIALKKDRKAILEKLQSLGVMETDDLFGENEAFHPMDTTGARAGFERNIQTLEQALSVLSRYAPEKSGMLSSLNGKEEITRAEYDEVVKARSITVDRAREIVRLDKEIADDENAIRKFENEIESLRPWEKLGLPMNFRGTDRTQLLLGTMPSQMTPEAIEAILKEALGAETADEERFELEILSTDRNGVGIAVLCLREDLETVDDALRAAGLVRPAVNCGKAPAAEAQAIGKKIESLQKRIEDLKEKITELASERESLKRTSDYFRMRSEKYAVLGTLPQSDGTFVLTGYVPEEAVPAVDKAIGEAFPCIVEDEPLREGEDGPTLLRNNRFSETVEGVLKSYGLPTRGHVDPTFVMSIFYVIFFGMMLSDAGYGLIMAIGCAVVLAKFKKMDAGMNKTLRMFFWCGLSTTFWGFMYGGFFGNAIDTIAQTFFGYTGETILKPLWFEPLAEPMRLLIWCMLFGLIHLFFGLALKGVEYLKQKDVVGFLSDVVAWYFLITGLTLMLMQSDIFTSIAGRSFDFPPVVGTVAKALAALGALVILLMSGRRNKNLAVRIALGAYDLYGVSGWLSDLLSYSRLLALGLATGVIANVINMMASMFGSGVMKVIVFIIVFVVGHILNLGINALGAYVHTNRLQFVEFFGKFYEGGGKEFKPFKASNKYVQIKEENQL